MHSSSNHLGKVLVMAASTRMGSINQALARHIAARMDATAPVEVVERGDYTLLLYDGDLEARDGVEPTRFVREAVPQRSAA